jgi:quinol-cytochrome oxidoreductase complex cytochrome b subunit
MIKMNEKVFWGLLIFFIVLVIVYIVITLEPTEFLEMLRGVKDLKTMPPWWIAIPFTNAINTF